MTGLAFASTAGEEVVLEERTIEALASRVRGQVLGEGSDDYDGARTVWNGMVDKRPALIVRCAGADDVRAAVEFAREYGLLVSVRGGGHNIAGKSVADGGLVIDLSGMRGVEVDPEKKVARVEGGALLGDLDRECQRFRLATTAGVVTHTGVGGLTVGGGVGRLARKHGLACDNLRSVELVTASGDVVRASPDEDQDLFWGVRGGGGNFGVVTSFEFELHPVGPNVLGGTVVHRFEDAQAALDFYHEFSRSAPDELSADAAFLTSPDGEPLFAVSVCYVGPIDEGERVVEPLRRFGSPLADEIQPVAYLDVQAAGDEMFPIGLRYYWKSHFLNEISSDAVEVIVSHFASAPSPRSMLVFQQYGGAIGRVDRAESAFYHRDAQYDAFPVSIWTDPAEDETHKDWVRAGWEAMKEFSSGGEYVNNLGEEGEDRVRAAYGENYERLASLKRTWDPTNCFRLNANIPPPA